MKPEGEVWGRGVPFPVTVVVLCGLKGGPQRAGPDGGTQGTWGRNACAQSGLSPIFPAGFPLTGARAQAHTESA